MTSSGVKSILRESVDAIRLVARCILLILSILLSRTELAFGQCPPGNPDQVVMAPANGNYCPGQNGVQILIQNAVPYATYEINSQPFYAGANPPPYLQLGGYWLAGNYTVFRLGCGTPIGQVTITQGAPFTASFTGFQNGYCPTTPPTILTASPSGGTYKWYKDGSLQVGETSQTYTVSSGGNYKVEVTKDGCSDMSDEIPVVADPINTPTVTIGFETGSSSICQGEAVKFKVDQTEFAGSAPTYQWEKNGSPVGSGTTWGPVTNLVHNDNISVVMTSNDPSCLSDYNASSSIPMTVYQYPGYFQLNGQETWCQGSPSLTEITIHNSENNIQYQLYDQQGPEGSPVNGNTGTISFGNLGPDQYYAMGTRIGTSCTFTSQTITRTQTAQFTVSIPPTNPTQYCAAWAQSVNRLTASPPDGSAYQWYNGATLIPGATSSTYDMTGPGSYWVAVTKNNCTYDNQASPWVVSQAPPVSPVVDLQVYSGTNPMCAGSSITFRAIPTVLGGGTPQYQWKKNGLNVGSNSEYYAVAPANGDQIKVVMTVQNPTACLTAASDESPTMTMAVNALPVNFSVSGGGTRCTYDPGFSISIPNSQSGVSYQLKLNGSNQGVPQTGNGSTLVFGTFTAAGTYSATGSINGCSKNSSSNTSIAVTNFTPTINPAGGEYCATSPLTLTAAPAGGTYQWQLGGADLVEETAQAFLVGGPGSDYTVEVTQSGCTYESSPVNVPAATVYTPQVSIAITQGSQAICSGDQVEFTATPTNGGSGPLYQWQINGTNYGSSSANNILLTSTLVDADSISCIMTSNLTECLSSTTAPSNSVRVTVHPVPSPPVVLDQQRFDKGLFTFSVQAPDPSLTYQWFDPLDNYLHTGVDFSVESAADLSVKINSNSSQCPGTDFTTATATIHPLPKLQINGPSFLQPGQTTQLSINNAYDAYQWKKNGAIIPGETAQSMTANTSGRYVGVAVLSNGVSQETHYSAAVAVLENIPSATNLAAPLVVNAPTPDSTSGPINYVRTYIPRTPVTDSAAVAAAPVDQVSVTTSYLDGLGRPDQTVIKQGSYDTLDVIQPVAYDAFGRQVRSYLPFEYDAGANAGEYLADALSQQYDFYESTLGLTGVPYSETEFEPSPANRVLKQAAPGEEWALGSGHEVKMGYRTNTIDLDDSIHVFTVHPEAVQITGPYPEESLFVTETTDENGGMVLEFTDKEGRTILKRVVDNDLTMVETYYVYDDLNNLRVVLPPQGVAELNDGGYTWLGTLPENTELVAHDLEVAQYDEKSYMVKPGHTLTLKPGFQFTASAGASFQAQMESPDTLTVDLWAFQYRYDHRKRMTAKKVPGSDWVYVVYDKWDRLAATQDGNQRLNGQWVFVKYDGLNRPAASGFYQGEAGASREDIQAMVDSLTTRFEDEDTTAVGYTLHRTFPAGASESDLLTVTYYDDYDFIQNSGWDAEGNDFDFVEEHGYDNTLLQMEVRGQVTGSKTRVLDGSSTWLNGVTYYDDRYRVIQTLSENVFGQVDRVTNRYDFVGNLTASYTNHFGEDTVSVSESLVYDHGNRLIRQWHSIGEKSIVWTDVEGYLQIISDTELERLSETGNDWTTGAASQQKLPPGMDGWVEFSPAQTGKWLIVGLSTANPDANWTTVKYGIRTLSGAYVYVSENGNNKDQTAYSAGDIFRIERIADTIYYKQNGTVFSKTPCSSNEELLVDVAIRHSLGKITALNASFAAQALLASNEYNQRGELTTRGLYSEDQGSTFKQSLDYNYNIRGWLTGINDHALSDPTDWFGLELFYNTGFDQDLDQYNGNIAGMKWKAATAEVQSADGFVYDAPNRIRFGDYIANSGGGWSADEGHYDLWVEDYDANGNLMSLERMGMTDTLAAVPQFGSIDNLDYVYAGNQLIAVQDSAADKEGRGDFGDGASNGTEYFYDANGNLTRDENKGITNIAYTYLNLPRKIDMGGGDSMVYVYDASGLKLKQRVYDSGSLLKATDYVGGIVYEDSVLQFIPHAEGRVVPDDSGYVYQYYLKDHLDNTRVTFTTKEETQYYMATFEADNAAYEEALFVNVTRHPFDGGDFPPSPDPDPDFYVARLDSAKKVGPAITIPVFPGDTVGADVFAYYEETGYGDGQSQAVMLVSVAAAFGGISGAPGEAGQIYDGIQDFFAGSMAPDPGGSSTVPSAYLNYIIFDGVYQVQQAGYIEVSSSANFQHELLSLGPFVVSKPGYLYTYLTYETQDDKWVDFDDFTIKLNKSPILAATDYYPFGLTIDALSWERDDAVPNRYLYNGIELQDELGFDSYLADFRSYDPALGRWQQIDPKASERESPYVGMANNPIFYADPLGDTVIWRDNDATNALRVQIDQLRQNSDLYNTVFTFLEESKDINVTMGVDDERVDAAAERLGFEGEERNSVGGYTTADGSEVVFRANASSKALAEEPFHVFQIDLYGGSRTRPEIESEAKLFDFDVVSENNESQGIPAGAIVGGGETGIIDVNISQMSTGRQSITGGRNLRAYKDYLGSFSNYQNSTNGPYRGAIRPLKPRAYNQAYQSRGKRR